MQSSRRAQRLKDRIALRERERLVLKRKLLSPKPMLEGSPVVRYTLCGNEGCICHKDKEKRHGPYWYLSFQREGKSKSRYIGGDTEKRKKVFLYRKHQANLAAFREVNRRIDEHLTKLKDLHLERPDE